ncbi:hypothetical protein ACHAXS_004600 [Conticribra weissflogii]
MAIIVFLKTPFFSSTLLARCYCYYNVIRSASVASTSSLPLSSFLHYSSRHNRFPHRHPRRNPRSSCRHRHHLLSSSFVVGTPIDISNDRRRKVPLIAQYTSSSSSSSSSEQTMIETTTTTTIQSVEQSITCSDGVSLAMKCWRNFDDGDSHPPTSPSTPTRKILCLHGWLDNAASFDRLAPLLLRSLSDAANHPNALPVELVALDFPGHGLSDHKSADGPPQLLAEYAHYVAEFFDATGWGSAADGQSEKVVLVGHSMGAGVAVIVAAAFPEWCRALVLLDGAGPPARNAEDAARHVRAACRRRIRSNRTLFPDGGRTTLTSSSSSSAAAKRYASVDAAVEARLDTTRRMPSDQYLSAEAARDMVIRATVPANDADGDAHGAVVFRHDPRLQWPSLQYYTREQVDAFYREVTCPTCVLSAEDGWPVDARTVDAVREVLKPAYVRRLRGSHHFHADPDTVGAVVEHIAEFLSEQNF